MKTGREALDQYVELAGALRELGAGWIVDEVEEVIARGRAVAFRDLPHDDKSRYKERLLAEKRKGLAVGKVRAADEVSVAYGVEDQLKLLVDAAERAIVASARSQASVVEFASRYHLRSVVLQAPDAGDTGAGPAPADELPITSRGDVDERLANLGRILRDQVLE